MQGSEKEGMVLLGSPYGDVEGVGERGIGGACELEWKSGVTIEEYKA